jgi:hypothetical protein
MALEHEGLSKFEGSRWRFNGSGGGELPQIVIEGDDGCKESSDPMNDQFHKDSLDHFFSVLDSIDQFLGGGEVMLTDQIDNLGDKAKSIHAGFISQQAIVVELQSHEFFLIAFVDVREQFGYYFSHHSQSLNICHAQPVLLLHLFQVSRVEIDNYFAQKIFVDVLKIL